MELGLRPTVWPGQPVAAPPVTKIDRVVRDGAWLLLESDHSSLTHVPQEVYLREFRDTDPGDLDALAELCSLGPIRPLEYHKPSRDLWTPGPWQVHMNDTAERLRLPPCADIEAERQSRFVSNSGYAVHATEVAYRVLCVRWCTDHVLAYREGRPMHKVWGCKDEEGAWLWFTSIIHPALRDFHIRVTIPRSEIFDIGGVHATLYSTAMLQLVNDLTEDVGYRRCANEMCGRLFARQRGRSEYGGHRMQGVMYCSNTCARAQYQREKRRRDRVARNGETVSKRANGDWRHLPARLRWRWVGTIDLVAMQMDGGGGT